MVRKKYNFYYIFLNLKKYNFYYIFLNLKSQTFFINFIDCYLNKYFFYNNYFIFKKLLIKNLLLYSIFSLNYYNKSFKILKIFSSNSVLSFHYVFNI